MKDGSATDRAAGRAEASTLVLHAEPEVPLLLATLPQTKQEAGEIAILLSFKEEVRAKLSALTSMQAPTEIAMVIGNEVVSRHRVREPIRDGNVKVTCCDPAACTAILDHLEARFRSSKAE